MLTHLRPEMRADGKQAGNVAWQEFFIPLEHVGPLMTLITQAARQAAALPEMSA